MNDKTTLKQVPEVRSVIINAKPKFDLGDKVLYRRGGGLINARVVMINIYISISDLGIRTDRVTYNIRWAVREMSNDIGFSMNVEENELESVL